jgi:hypothetical protein
MVKLSGRGINPSRRALPGNIQQSTATDKHDLAGFEPAVPATELPQNPVLDHAAIDNGQFAMISIITRILGGYSLQFYFSFHVSNLWRYRMP